MCHRNDNHIGNNGNHKMKTLKYNYPELSLIDLRYRGNDDKGHYILAFITRDGKRIYPVNIDKSIFETVLYKYFTPLFKYTREDLFKLKFCAYLSEGHFMEWDSYAESYKRQDGKAERIYASRLDIKGHLDGSTRTGLVTSPRFNTLQKL